VKPLVWVIMSSYHGKLVSLANVDPFLTCLGRTRKVEAFEDLVLRADLKFSLRARNKYR